eukprot:CAMPEP_0185260814 /NCGR_PEP_ID=MMETSP1359-20130426/9358_1 /TAXON_ID=552665 /ORGANISM="Bigelowiella longifila, Strain CCMP242" /LENGTH=92 /DNA_ID=CAMNT_0027847233 /DNA_START=75 /DNA_END=351 /DNA_ORIENTATION=-
MSMMARRMELDFLALLEMYMTTRINHENALEREKKKEKKKKEDKRRRRNREKGEQRRQQQNAGEYSGVALPTNQILYVLLKAATRTGKDLSC